MRTDRPASTRPTPPADDQATAPGTFVSVRRRRTMMAEDAAKRGVAMVPHAAWEERPPPPPAAPRALAPAAFREAIGFPRLSRLFDYWLTLAPAGGPPPRQAVDPLHIPDLLPHVYLLEADPATYRVRLAGTAIRALFGVELTGASLLSVLPPLHRANAERSYGAVIAQRVAWCSINLYRLPGARMLRYVRIALPLATGSAPVDQILGGIDWDQSAVPNVPLWEVLGAVEGVDQRDELVCPRWGEQAS